MVVDLSEVKAENIKRGKVIAFQCLFVVAMSPHACRMALIRNEPLNASPPKQSRFCKGLNEHQEA